MMAKASGELAWTDVLSDDPSYERVIELLSDTSSFRGESLQLQTVAMVVER